MAKAIWNGTVVADSDETVVVEGNHYFPPDSIKREFFKEHGKETTCYWKGKASYYSLEVDGQVNEAAAWTYRDPKEKAAHFKDYVAFWNGVKVEA